jgi:hypothetical protein
MSTNMYARLVVGVDVDPEDFWTQNGVKYKCENGHKSAKGVAFCDKCGTRIMAVGEYEPTDGFAAWCDEIGGSPEEIFEGLMESCDCFEWSIGSAKPCQTGEDSGAVEVFGKMLRDEGSCSYSSPGDKPGAIEQEELASVYDELHEVMQTLGIDRRVKVYCQLYISC